MKYATVVICYRVHNTDSAVSFANLEQLSKEPTVFGMRGSILRKIARSRLQVKLPASFHDLSHEEALFCLGVCREPLLTRWRRVMCDSHAYLPTVVANPCWSLKKKIGLLALSGLCLPHARLSDFVVSQITNPPTRRRTVER